MTTKEPTPQLDELEQKLLKDKAFQHILKFAPESQRELMTFELARYFTQLLLQDRVDELKHLSVMLEENRGPVRWRVYGLSESERDKRLKELTKDMPTIPKDSIRPPLSKSPSPSKGLKDFLHD